jgi:hypothetical protein
VWLQKLWAASQQLQAAASFACQHRLAAAQLAVQPQLYCRLLQAVPASTALLLNSWLCKPQLADRAPAVGTPAARKLLRNWRLLRDRSHCTC